MNVKLQIKEVKDERRRLSDFEWYAYFAGQRIVEPLIYLDKVGLILQSVDTFERVGTFRTETIRDATPTEVIAWHCTQIKKECDMIGGGECAKCPKHISKIAGCIASSDYLKSKAILEGKIVSVEYCEE